MPTGPTMKSLFTGDEMKLLQFGLAQCPKVDKIKKAVLDPKGNEGQVTSQQLGALVRVWPKETELQSLVDDPPGENEKWAKAEEYMIQLISPLTLI